jgi:16S rRNA (guanine1516-N2)-methyltransferase
MNTARIAASAAVTCADPALQAQAEELAARLDLPLDLPIAGEAGSSREYRLLLCVGSSGLELVRTDDFGPSSSVRVDFAAGRTAFRRKQQKREILLRAAGFKPDAAPAVIDATGGLGRDSFVLAAAGCRVHVFERHPIIAALLADGLERACSHPASAAAARRIRLTQGDAVAALQAMEECGEQTDVVYLDPMFPERRKSALVKKDLQLLQLLASADASYDQLLHAALRTAAGRVVVKRPVKSPFLADLRPSHSLTGKTVRFDVYLTALPVPAQGCSILKKILLNN